MSSEILVWNMGKTPSLKELMVHYPKNTAGLRIVKPDGTMFDWFVGATATDNTESLQAHVARHWPDCTLLEWAYNP